MFWVDDGCPSSGIHRVEGSFQITSYRAGVRCCSNNGMSCTTPAFCYNNKMSFHDASSNCSEYGRRLCTKKELLGGLCCDTGGNCDYHEVWTSTPLTGTYKDYVFRD